MSNEWGQVLNVEFGHFLEIIVPVTCYERTTT